jgi:hypothetical protein
MAHRPLAHAHPARSRSVTSCAGAVVAAVLALGVAAAGFLPVVTLGTTAASAATGGSSTTCSPAALNAARAHALAALTRRVTRLHDLSAAIGASTGLTPTHRSTLTTDIGNDLAGITALQQKVPSDTTCAAVVADAHAMVVDYRVFVVLSPQVHLTIAADTETSVAGALAALEPKIAARITAAKQKGVTVRAPESTFADFQSQVTSAAQSSAGVAGPLPALTPASYPGCRQTLENARTSLTTGRVAIVRAHADLRTLKADAR